MCFSKFCIYNALENAFYGNYKSHTGQLVQLSRERSLPGSTVSTIRVKICEPACHEPQDGCPTGNILVASERSNDGGLIGKNNLVLGSGGEQTLKKSNGGVEDNGALHAGLHADLNLAIVDEVRANALDV